MYLLKKATCLLIMLSMLTSIFVHAANFTVDDSFDLSVSLHSTSGIQMTNQKNTLLSSKTIDSQFNISNLTVSNNQLTITALFKLPSHTIPISQTGDLYLSPFTDNTFIVLFSPEETYSIESFVLELNPNPDLLLGGTKTYIAGAQNILPILKVGIIVHGENYYYEYICQNLNQQINNISKRLPCAEKGSALEHELYANERWSFIQQIQKANQIDDISAYARQNTVNIFKALSENDSVDLSTYHTTTNSYSIRATSPIDAISPSLFSRIGTSRMTGDDECGWFMSTSEYPLNSGNYMSLLLYWEYITPSSVSKYNYNELNIKVFAAGEYFYDTEEDIIYKLTDYHAYELKDVVIGASLLTANGDIMTGYSFNAAASTASLSGSNAVITFLGLFDRTATVASIAELISDLISNNETLLISSDTFPDTLDEDGWAYTALACKLPQKRSLQAESDRFIVSFKWQPPANCTSYVSGNKTVSFSYIYSVCSAVDHNVINDIEDVSVTIRRTYQ